MKLPKVLKMQTPKTIYMKIPIPINEERHWENFCIALHSVATLSDNFDGTEHVDLGKENGFIEALGAGKLTIKKGITGLDPVRDLNDMFDAYEKLTEEQKSRVSSEFKPLLDDAIAERRQSV